MKSKPGQYPKGQEATFGSLAVKERPAAIEAGTKKNPQRPADAQPIIALFRVFVAVCMARVGLNFDPSSSSAC